MARPFAVVTGGTNGIGLELAKLFLEDDHDVLIAGEDDTHSEDALTSLTQLGKGEVTLWKGDLGREEEVTRLFDAVRATERPVDALCVNAGVGLGGPFTETNLARELQMIDVNVRGAVQLTKLVLREMHARDAGRILLTSSIAATMPDPFEAVYGATKVFLRWFGEALRNELRDSGVTVTVLMPSMTDTNFFNRAEMMDTRAGQAKKDDAGEVAKAGYDALMAGRDKVVPLPKNKVMAAIADLLPDRVAASAHRRLSEPGSAERKPGAKSSLPTSAAIVAAGALLFAGWRARPHRPARMGGTPGDAVAKALHITLDARSGKEQEVEALLRNILAEIEVETSTRPWFGLRRDGSTFEIFEAFPDEASRTTHLSGPGAALLMERSNALLTRPARIDKLDVLVRKGETPSAAEIIVSAPR